MAMVFLSKDDTKTTWSHCVIAAIFIAYHTFFVVVIVWDHLVVVVLSYDGSDVLEPAPGI